MGDREFDPAFAHFVQDLAGFLNKYKRLRRVSWNIIAGECRLAHKTVTNLANFRTRNPQTYTVWKLLRRMDCSPQSFSGKIRGR